MGKKRRAPSGPPHIRIYVWEMKTEAWRALSVDARALLIEFRALWNVDNRIPLSIRQMMQRLGIGQRRAAAARDELLARGWIRLMEQGSFTRKVRHAALYAATNEPLHPGKPATKEYMTWSPQKNTVASMATDGSHDSYRAHSNSSQKER